MPVRTSSAALRHAQQAQALTCGGGETGIPAGTDGKPLMLGRRPFRHQELRQRLSRAHHIPRGERPDTFDETGDPGLHHRHGTFIESHEPGRVNFAHQRKTFHCRQTYPQVLGKGRVDLHADGPFPFVGIFRYQLHVHERRLAWPVKMMLGEHRVVPVQHPAFAPGLLASALCGRLAFAGVTHPPAARAGAQGQQARSDEQQRKDFVQRPHF
jgi:hypothetical protein